MHIHKQNLRNRKTMLAYFVQRTVIYVAIISGFILTGIASANGSKFDAEQDIAELIQLPDIQAAFRTIEDMDAKNIQRLVAITEIPAPPFNESVRALDFASRLRALGLSDVSTDDVGNVIARRAGKTGRRTIAISAHIDTVFPPDTDLSVRREDDVFFAPGIADNSRGLVVVLSLVETLEKHALVTDADLLFIGTVGEEGLGDLRGVRNLFNEGAPKIDSIIVIDGGKINRVVVDAVGSTRYRVTFNGPGGHSFGAFGRAHPHQALGEAISLFTKNAKPITEGKPKATFSVGRIGGGTSINSIPFSSWMEVDMRSANVEKLAALDSVFTESVNAALANENAISTKGDKLTVDIKLVGDRPAGQSDRTIPLTQHVSAAMTQLGITPDLRASSTDANIPISLGLPAVTLSRGGVSKNAHSLKESWQNKDPHLAIQVILLTLLAEAKLCVTN